MKPIQRFRAARFEFLKYGFFLLSTGRFQTFRAWRAHGKPNPFLKKEPENRQVRRSEIVRIFSRLDGRSPDTPACH